MTETTFELADVEHLAATLDVVELDEKDRATLHAIFALAGTATSVNEDEVTGFAVDAFIWFDHASPNLTGNLLGSFQWGSRHGAQELNPQPLPP